MDSTSIRNPQKSDPALVPLVIQHLALGAAHRMRWGQAKAANSLWPPVPARVGLRRASLTGPPEPSASHLSLVKSILDQAGSESTGEFVHAISDGRFWLLYSYLVRRRIEFSLRAAPPYGRTVARLATSECRVCSRGGGQ